MTETKFNAGIVAGNLRAYRARKRLTQKEVAEAVDVSEATIVNYESGQSVPSYEVMWRLADLYDVSLDAIGDRQIPA